MDSETKDMIECRMDACRNHPERRQIFCLEKMLIEAGYPYFFNFWEELRPTPFNDAGDPEKDINWDSYPFLIEVGPPAGYALSMISVCFNQKGDPKLLELLDMRPAGDKKNPTAEDGELHADMTAEDCMGIIGKFFESLPPIQETEFPEDYYDDEEEDIETMKRLDEAIRKITGIDPDEVDKKAKRVK